LFLDLKIEEAVEQISYYLTERYHSVNLPLLRYALGLFAVFGQA
ncbi:MAG: hypothetical protein ACI82Z_001975, partial [Cellvibrionaceae bacterium]